MFLCAKVRKNVDISKYFFIFLSETFAVSDFCSTFAPALVKKPAALSCPDGGIGRRAGLKHQWGNPCRFDPGSGYKDRFLTKAKVLQVVAALFIFSVFSWQVGRGRRRYRRYKRHAPIADGYSPSDRRG